MIYQTSPPGTALTQTFVVTNAALTSSVHISPANALSDGLIIAYARVVAAGSVEVKFFNASGADIDAPVQDFYITVVR